MTGAVTPAEPPEHPQHLRPESGRVVAIDLQEKLMPAVAGGDAVAARAALLIRAASRLDVPVRATEQVPGKLGATVGAVCLAYGEAVDGAPAAKTAFGAAAALGLTEAVSDDRHQAILCGVETHVCVAQTALELLSAGYSVSVCADACGSRSAVDHAVALDRLRGEGVVVTTVEAVLFEWLGSADHPRFKAVSELVKAAGPA